MPEVRSPTVRRRELGALLRTLRTERGLTVEQVGEELLCSPSKVSRMETGQRGATARDIRDLCDLYGVTDPAQREHLATLAAEGKQQGWWQPYELEFATYVGLEEAAESIKDFSPAIVMGLLQTRRYARAMHERGWQDFAADRIDALVEVRMRRQRLLERNPPVPLHLVMEEVVLRRVVGGPAVMAEQLDRLVELAELPHITMQVIPNDAGAHPAMGSNFTMLEFGGAASNVVYVEGLVGWLYLERQQDLKRYYRVFERLCQIALSPRDSIQMIAEIAALYKSAAVSETDAGNA